MEWRFVSYLENIYLTSYQNYKRKRILGCIETTDWRFLRIKGDQNQKAVQSIFRENELKIIIQWNLEILDYSDVTFNLKDSPYCRFSKTNKKINYLHKQSNYPPTIIMQFPLSVERVLSKLSLHEKIFNYSIPIRLEALKKAGYNQKLTYLKHDQKKDNSHQHKR